MVGPEGDSLNPILDVLADWNEYLETAIPDFQVPSP